MKHENGQWYLDDSTPLKILGANSASPSGRDPWVFSPITSGLVLLASLHWEGIAGSSTSVALLDFLCLLRLCFLSVQVKQLSESSTYTSSELSKLRGLAGTSSPVIDSRTE